jgi:spermidine synthase
MSAADLAAGRGRHRIALALLLASGFAALGLQLAWTQQAALWLGHETAGVLAVLAGFFGGVATGAALLAPRIERSARPARGYAACEAVVALWALVLLAAMPAGTDLLVRLTGAQPSTAWHWTVAFVGTYVLLLPATAAMGATLPAMERVLAQWTRGNSALAALYAGNTLGAVLGVLASAFWLVPQLGVTRTIWLCAALDLVCAAVAWRLQAAPNPMPLPARATAGSDTSPGCSPTPGCWASASK